MKKIYTPLCELVDVDTSYECVMIPPKPIKLKTETVLYNSLTGKVEKVRKQKPNQQSFSA